MDYGEKREPTVFCFPRGAFLRTACESFIHKQQAKMRAERIIESKMPFDASRREHGIQFSLISVAKAAGEFFEAA